MLKQVEKEFLDRLSYLYDLQEIKEIFLLCAEDVLGLSRTEIILKKDSNLDDEVIIKFDILLSSLEKGIPVQYVLGYSWFYGMKLKVNEAVLIPRPETEELVALILKENRHRTPKILDIGTGSGCIPIAIKKHLPEAEVWALDISPEALKVASENAQSENCVINFVEADIFLVDKLFAQTNFDLIVSNPPYIPPSEKSAMAANVLDHEPHLALFIPEENPLLFYRVIINFAKERLCKGGKLYFEINRRFSQELKENLVRAEFVEVEIHMDIHGSDRMVSARKS